MGRACRVHLPRAFVHVTQKCHNSALLLMDDADKALYLELLQEVARELSYDIISYCLQDTHPHQVLCTPAEVVGHTLSEFMFRLNNRFSHRFNVRHERTGTVWNGRYKATGWLPLTSWLVLEVLLWYVEGNTARRRVHPVGPRDWSWCSLHWVLRGEPGPVETRLAFYLNKIYGARGQPDPIGTFERLVEEAKPDWAARTRNTTWLWLNREESREIRRAVSPDAWAALSGVRRNWKTEVERYSLALLPLLET